MSSEFKVTLWGTRGSLATPGADKLGYGGNTACVSVQSDDGTLLVLDAGTGIRNLGLVLPPDIRRVDLLLTHLHMDHVQGIGFFRPIRTPGVDVHVWGPAASSRTLAHRLSRYLSPPLFPVYLREMECNLHLHEVPCGDFQVGPYQISCEHICHPDPSVGYRVATARAAFAYLPDHEPALGTREFSVGRDWISGSHLVENADLLVHDSQYTDAQYAPRVGWGHSSLRHAIQFAALNGVKEMVTFHHDPSHTDGQLDQMLDSLVQEMRPPVKVTPGREGTAFEL
ncbi:MAG: MBL fold metallo-hydrolase [Anaerolineae bacterium]